MGRSPCLRVGWLLLALLAASSGCGTLESKQQQELLGSSVRAFAKFMRWGAYEPAAAYRRSRSGELPPQDLRPLASIRIASYEIVNQVVGEDPNSAEVLALISYYSDDTGTVYTTRYRQSWWYDPESKRWWLDGNLPAFEEARPAIRLTPDR